MAAILVDNIHIPGSTEILHALVPISWVVCSVLPFTLAFSQQPGPRRNLLLSLVVGSLTLGFVTSDRLPAGISWLWAFLCIIGIIHHSAGLLIESWIVPPANPPRLRNILYLGLKLWANPRRLQARPLDQKTTASWHKRLSFVLRKAILILILGTLYLAGETVIVLVLYPMPMDWRVSFRHHFGFRPSHPALVRSVFCVHWVWESFVFLTIGHAALAVMFVGILRVDSPSEWPWLWGSPMEAYSLQRFWGVFWHKIGSTSQLRWGRYISQRILSFKTNIVTEKVFLAFFVFMASSAIHILVSWKVKEASMSVEKVYEFSVFLFFNFLAGLVEFAIKRLLRHHFQQGKEKTEQREVPSWCKLLGFLWVFLFFYCTLPPWKYPYFPGYENEVKINFNVHSSR